MRESKSKKEGFIALISVIIISSILLLISINLSVSNLSQRENIFRSEMKEKSLSNAEACVDEALLYLGNNSLNTSTTTITLDALNTCFIGPIPNSGNPRVFFVKASYQNYFTNIMVEVNPINLSVISWREV